MSMMRNSMVVWTRLIRTGSRTCPIGQTVSPLKLKTRELTEIISLVGILKDLYRFLYIILDDLMGSTWTLLTSQMENLRVMTSASLWGVSMPWRSLSEKTQLLQFPSSSLGRLSTVIYLVCYGRIFPCILTFWKLFFIAFLVNIDWSRTPWIISIIPTVLSSTVTSGLSAPLFCWAGPFMNS